MQPIAWLFAEPRVKRPLAPKPGHRAARAAGPPDLREQGMKGSTCSCALTSAKAVRRDCSSTGSASAVPGRTESDFQPIPRRSRDERCWVVSRWGEPGGVRKRVTHHLARGDSAVVGGERSWSARIVRRPMPASPGCGGWRGEWGSNPISSREASSASWASHASTSTEDRKVRGGARRLC